MDIWDIIEANIDKHSENLKSIDTSILTKIKKPINTSINLTITLTRSGTYIDGLTGDLLKKIQNYYTLSDKQIMGYFKKTTNWELDRNRLYIPRFGSLFLANKFNTIYKNTIIKMNHIPNMTYTGTFNGNQEIIFNNIMLGKFSEKNMLDGKSGLILNLMAGHGKTFLAMALINKIKCRTLIVVHNSSILDQWVKLLSEYFPTSTIGQYYGKKKTYGDIVVGVINSLVQPEIKLLNFSTNPREFYDTFDMVVFDEAHEYCSPSRNQIYKIAQCPYMLGLSATPQDRPDSLDKINHWGIGPVLVADQIVGYTTKDITFKGHVIKVNYSGPEEYTEHLINEKLDLTSVPLMIGQLCEDPFRLDMIIELILEQHKSGMNTLVFADRRSYLEVIRLELDKKSLESNILTNNLELDAFEASVNEIKQVNEIKTIRLVGGSTQKDFELAKETKNIILSTYQYLSTGVSIPKMNCVVLVTPRKSKSRQIISRIFRLGSNYDIVRKIVDIVDVKTSLKNQWQTRKLYYNEQNYTEEVRKISYKDIKK